MGRRIAMLACVSGLASSKPYYKGHEAKDRIIHTNLKRDLSEGAEYVEAYCGSGQDVMTCWDSYVLIPLGDQFSKCWDIPEDKAQCAWTIGISAIGDFPGQCGTSVVERARYNGETRVHAKFPGQKEHADRGCPANYEHSASGIMMFPADEETQPIFKGVTTCRVEHLVYEQVKEELPTNALFRGYPHMNGAPPQNCRSDVYPEGAPDGRYFATYVHLCHPKSEDAVAPAPFVAKNPYLGICCQWKQSYKWQRSDLEKECKRRQALRESGDAKYVNRSYDYTARDTKHYLASLLSPDKPDYCEKHAHKRPATGPRAGRPDRVKEKRVKAGGIDSGPTGPHYWNPKGEDPWCRPKGSGCPANTKTEVKPGKDSKGDGAKGSKGKGSKGKGSNADIRSFFPGPKPPPPPPPPMGGFDSFPGAGGSGGITA